MSIGQSRQIKLIQITPAKGSEGNWNSEVETSFNTWAEISNGTQGRDYANGQVKLGETKRFKVRFRFDQYPEADWKVRYAGKDWTVSSVTKESEKQFYWVITASS
jgi:SPP1 family predicted phage head-tail adaptor